MFDFLRDFFGRLFGDEEWEGEDFIGLEGISDGEGEGIQFDIATEEEQSALWDYWIEEPIGDLAALGSEFYSLEDAINYVEGAPYGVLWIYINPEDGTFEIYRYYEG